MGVEAFGFYERLAVESKSAFAVMLGRLLQHGLLGPSWSWEDEELAVGKDTVDVEKQELDFAGARLSRDFWHRREF